MFSVELLETALANSLRCYRFSHSGVIADIREFLGDVSAMMQAILELNLDFMGALKFWLCATVEFVKSDDDGERKIFHLPIPLSTILNVGEIPTAIQANVETMRLHVESFEQRGSNWIVLAVHMIDLHCVKYRPLKGSSYVRLPEFIVRKNAVVNVQNTLDNECFRWCILAFLHPVPVHPERISNYRAFVRDLDFSNIAFPVSISSIEIFCDQNPNISVNVYTADGPIRPIRTAKDRKAQHVNLLLYKGHYSLIRHFDRLMGDQNRHEHKKFYCDMCLFPFYSAERLADHSTRCLRPNFSKIEMPDHEILRFRNTKKMIRRPVVIYADFECMLEPQATQPPPQAGSFKQKYQKHIPCAFGAVSVKSCCDDKLNFGTYESFTGPDCAQKFLDYAIRIAKGVKSLSNALRAHNLTPAEEQSFTTSNSCWICDKTLDADRVRDHCHMCGKYRGPAHSSCNSELQASRERVVFFHNLRRYDGHILIRAIGDLCADSPGMKVNCIAKVTEDYISFSLTQHARKRHSASSNRDTDGFKIIFLDSCQFLLSSLDDLAKNVPRNEFYALENFFQNQDVNLLKRKGVFPYDYLDAWAKLDETAPPSRDAFDNQLNNTSVLVEDYDHMLKVWREFNVQTFGEYMELYLKTDCMILCDVFENFRRFALNKFGLDPCHYVTLPSFSWDACFKLTKAELELLSDPDMYAFFAAGIRGGQSVVSKRYAEANNPYLDDFDPTLPISYLLYVDANNLYGGGMVKKHAVGGYAWLTEDEIKWIFDNIMSIDLTGDTGYALEVDLEYPAALHAAHNCYPLAAERLRIQVDMLSPHCRTLLGDSKHISMEKLAPNLFDKTEYIIDGRVLQFFLGKGLRLLKIHRGIRFTQEAWMRPYIEYNTIQRRLADSQLMKNFFKLMNNSVYGKTMEDVFKHSNIELVTSERRFLKVTKKPEFVRAVIFTENLVACVKHRHTITLNKPIYVGFNVLELSKMTMYRFHYEYIREVYGDRAVLCMTDTDSFLYHIFTPDVYRDMLEHLDEFDTSQYPTDHFLNSEKNKGVLGKMTDEAKGKPISKYVGLRSKMYSYCVGGNECKRAKGIKKDVVRRVLTYDNYLHALRSNEVRYDDMRMIRSYLHELFSVRLHKKSLSSFDDKRYILDDGIHTLAYGHCDINPGASGANAQPAQAPPQ